MAQPDTPFVVGIAHLVGSHGAERPLHLEAPVDFHVELSRTLGAPPLVGDFVLAAVSGGILVRGSVAVTARHTCHRCLDEFDEPIDLEVAQLFSFEPLDDADDDDYAVDGDMVDLEPMMRDEVILAFPLRPLCREDCPGLGAVLESDLNTAASGDSGDTGSPFAVLRDLLEPGE